MKKSLGKLKAILHFVDKLKTWQGIATTNSMAPLIEKGDLIWFEKASPNSIKPLDIIAYKRNRTEIIVHRFIKREKGSSGNFFLTEGDNIGGLEPVPEHQLLGKATVIEKRNTKIQLTNNLHKIFYKIRFSNLLKQIFLKTLIRG